MKSINFSRFLMLKLAIILFLGFIQSQAQTPKTVKTNSIRPSVSKTQKEEIENIIREYLLNNPSIIREALQELRAREEQEKILLIQSNLKTLKSEIYADVNSPVAGSKSGDVPIVVFYDYFCGYCRRALPELEKLIAEDSSIRVIYKEFPIMGPQSHFAALATLAANRQGKFTEFHRAILAADDEIDEKAVREIAGRIGLNPETLEKDMKDPKLAETIERNIRLAIDLSINGTPAYIVGDQIIPGAIDSDSLKKLVANQRVKLHSATNSKIVADLK